MIFPSLPAARPQSPRTKRSTRGAPPPACSPAEGRAGAAPRPRRGPFADVAGLGDFPPWVPLFSGPAAHCCSWRGVEGSASALWLLGGWPRFSRRSGERGRVWGQTFEGDFRWHETGVACKETHPRGRSRGFGPPAATPKAETWEGGLRGTSPATHGHSGLPCTPSPLSRALHACRHCLLPLPRLSPLPGVLQRVPA